MKIEELRAERDELCSCIIFSFRDLASHSNDKYPYTATFEHNDRDPVLVLHSSGSTGMLFKIESVRKIKG